GGGHRSAAEAIIEALNKHYPDRCEPLLVDVIKDYLPRPLDMLPESYPIMARVPEAWELGFRLLDGRRRGQAFSTAFWPYIKSRVEQLVQEQPADLIVSVHPLLTDPVLKAWGKDRPYFITVVTDLITGPALWYHRKVDLTIVPTVEARRRAIDVGVPAERVRVIGLPVAERFTHPAGEPAQLRQELGWPQDVPLVLLVGGAEGMGPLYQTARAIARLKGDFALAVVAGRNEGLKRRLEAVDWEVPTIIHGFEREMHKLMQAATLLVTKAGPGTITEALNAGLPMVLYSRIPGQEDGNVDYVVDKSVGTWAPSPQATAGAVRTWLSSPSRLAEASKACKEMARPQAAVEIAEILISNLGKRETGPNGKNPLPG
ncbi:MAG: MGDG synthase family glycosyltransferase, partial [Anaerolineales bacterium]